MIKSKINQKFVIFLTLFMAVLFFGISFLTPHQNPVSLLSPTVCHAQSLDADLTSPGTDGSSWLFPSATGTPGVWTIMLGLANIFVAFILIFFAFINIVHINYDSYQLKKVMPKLIIGIIMANFSMVITRLVVDLAQLLTLTFSQDTRGLATGVMCALNYDIGGGGFGKDLLGGFSLVFLIIAALAIMIAVAIMSFLLWIRKIIILLLVAASPLAFIMLAFPPTESYFKKWWDWLISWAFMGPIVMFLMWVASLIGAGNCDGKHFTIGSLFAVCGLLYLAAIVPFKLGGPAMNAWGKAGKYLAKDNPYSKRKIERATTAMQNKYAGTAMGRMGDASRAADEKAIENSKGLRESKFNTRMAEHMEKNKDLQKVIDREILYGKNAIENIKLKMQVEIDSNNLGDISSKSLKRITGNGDASSVLGTYSKQNTEMRNLKEQYEKNQTNTLETSSEDQLRRDKKARKALKAMKKAGIAIDSNVDLGGTQLAGGATVKLSVAEAQDAVERLRDAAGPLEGPAKQAKMDQANELQNQIEKFKDQHQVVSGTGTLLDNQKIDYDDVLGKNAGGRRHKNSNVPVYDDAKTKYTSDTIQGIIADTEDKVDAQGNIVKALMTDGVYSCDQGELDKGLTGQQFLVDDHHRAEVERTVRVFDESLRNVSARGEEGVKNTAGIHDIETRVNRAQERELVEMNRNRTAGTPVIKATAFSEKTSQKALSVIDSQDNDTKDATRLIQQDITTQYNASHGTAHRDYATLVTAGGESDALKDFDIAKTDMNEPGGASAIRRSFRDAKVAAIRSSKQLGISSTAAVNLSQIEAPEDGLDFTKQGSQAPPPAPPAPPRGTTPPAGPAPATPAAPAATPAPAPLIVNPVTGRPFGTP